MQKTIEVYGKKFEFSDLVNHVGDIKSVAGVRPYTLFDGPERGVFAVDVWTGSGLQYTVLPDRGMNICNARYKGFPLEWVSPTGITAPYYYEFPNINWLRSFNGGLVHTCGLDNVGNPCVDEGILHDEKTFGIHGRIGNTPARELSWSAGMENGTYTMCVSGKCRAVSALEENLTLQRKVISELGGKSIIIKDTVTNHGYHKTPVFLLYHCNFGFPLLSGDTILSFPTKEAIGRDGKPVTDFGKIIPPGDIKDETVFYPIIKDESVKITLFNPKLSGSGIGIQMKYKRAELPHLTVWKFFQNRLYALGIEPGTCRVDGRKVEKEKGRAIYLEADQSISISLEIEVIETM